MRTTKFEVTIDVIEAYEIKDTPNNEDIRSHLEWLIKFHGHHCIAVKSVKIIEVAK